MTEPVNNPPPDDNPPPTPPSPPDNSPSPGGNDWDTERATLQEQIEKLTSEGQRNTELIAQLSKILDPSAKPDPDKLASQLEERDQTLRQRTIELAVVRWGGASADALLDSRSFMDLANKLDPNASDFSDKIKGYIKKHSVTKLPAKAGGADISGGGDNAGKGQWTLSDLNGKSPEQIRTARKQGLLDNLAAGRAS